MNKFYSILILQFLFYINQAAFNETLLDIASDYVKPGVCNRFNV